MSATDQSLQNPDAGWASVQNVPFGVAQYLPVQLQSLLFMPFSFSVSYLPLTAGQAATAAQFTVGNDSHFVLTNVTGWAYTTAQPPVTLANPGVLVQYTDTGSGYQLQDFAQPFATQVGSMGAAAGQFLYTVPYLAEANSTFVCQASNFDTSESINLRLSFGGFKVYGVPRDNPQIAIPQS
jgi:hypothetical protein